MPERWMRGAGAILFFAPLIVGCGDLATTPEALRLKAGTVVGRFVLAGEHHSAFPSALMLQGDTLVTVFRKGAEHVDDGGRIDIVRHVVEGDSLRFLGGGTVIDTELDDRDPSIMRTSGGVTLLNFMAGEPILDYRHRRISVLRSLDDGRTWGPRDDLPVDRFGK